jgi:hypothetical protein
MPEVGDVDDDEAARVLAEIKMAATALRVKAPDHYRYLLSLRGHPPAAPEPAAGSGMRPERA